MKPVKFPWHNIVIAKDQKDYIPIPAYAYGDRVIFCWKLSFKERLKLLFTGKLWHHVLTFGGPLQPQLLELNNPFPFDETR